MFQTRQAIQNKRPSPIHTMVLFFATVFLTLLIAACVDDAFTKPINQWKDVVTIALITAPITMLVMLILSIGEHLWRKVFGGQKKIQSGNQGGQGKSAVKSAMVFAFLVFFMFALVVTSRAQTPNVAVAGTVKDLGGDAVPGTEVRARLYNCGDNAPKSGGVLVGAAKSKSIPVDAVTGAFSAMMFGNDQLTCGGIPNTTDYYFGVYVNGKLVGPEQRYHLTGNSFNPATQQAVNDEPPSSSNDYAIRNGDNTWHGVQDFTGATVDFTGANVAGLATGPGGGAPTDGSYVTMKAEAGLSNETTLANVNARGPIASRPSPDPNKAGRLYCTNDLGSMRCTRDNGASWDDQYVSWNYIDGKPSTFTPSAHASTHASAGSDPITISESQVSGLTTDLAAKQPLDTQLTQLATPGASGTSPVSNGTDYVHTDIATQAELDAHTSNTSNPHSVTKAQVGLGSVPNADATNAGNISTGTLAGARLPNPAVGTKGGVESKTCGGTDKVSAIGTDGIPVCSPDQTGAAGGGITTLNGSTQTTQSFVNGTNINVSTNAGTGAHTFSVTGTVAAAASVPWAGITSNPIQGTPDLGKVCIGQGDGTCVYSDPWVQGVTAHDASGSSTNPVAAGGYASAAAPTDVSADGDIVRAWFLRNGAQAIQSTHNGALIDPRDVSDRSGRLLGTITNTSFAATQSGNWSVRNQDGSGNPLASSTSAPAGTEQGLIVRPIPSGTQTVSGTVSATQSGTWSVRNQDGAGNALASSTTTPAGTEQALIVRNVPSGTQTVSGTVTTTPPSNASTNITQVGGTAIDTNSGNKSAGTVRVTIATDQVQLTNALKVDGSAVTQPVSIAATVTTQDTSTGATGSAVPSRAELVGGTDGTNLVAQFMDPCQGPATRSVVPISITANTQVITGQASKKVYICSINIGPIGTATAVALVEGSGTTCATSTAGMAGGATAATGWSFGANGGIVLGTGDKAVAWTATSGDNVCLFVSAANQVSGVMTYAIR